MAKFIVGVDEVGRGPWAGPVAAAAVILPAGCRLPGVKDSKLLNFEQRLEQSFQIRRKALAIGIGWTSHGYIDRYGLTVACRRAMRQAVRQLNHNYQQIIIDGSYNFLASTHPTAQAIIKADHSHKCVSAASIIAKVARDHYMISQARIYPEYGFEQHFGYGTPMHKARVLEHGLSGLHRLSFRPKILQARLELVPAGGA